MGKYMVIASYTADGAAGLLKDGGSARVKAVEAVASGVGGKVESFYFGFGSDDVYVVLDLPDHASAAATSLVVGASGAVNARTIVLMTPPDIDAAAEASKGLQYRRPGG